MLESFKAARVIFARDHKITELMAKLISSRYSMQTEVPESYILPPEQRPDNSVAFLCKTIPVIDFGSDRSEVIQKIMKACQEYGFFQLINHGVSDELMKDALMVAKEFFDLPVEEKERFYFEDKSENKNLSFSVKTSLDFPNEKFHFWRDGLRLFSHPLEDHIHHWPENPARFRGVFGPYSVEVRKLGLQILDLISEGLGLQSGYFGGRLSEGHMIAVNHYPPCPDPTLVLGLPKHGDTHLITLLNQDDVPGLQVWKDEQWLTVEPIPNAFVVNINYKLQIISNGKLKSAYHRAFASSKFARTSIAALILPYRDSLIEPAKSLVSELSPPLYRSFTSGEFQKIEKPCDSEEGNEWRLEHFRIRS